MLVFTERLSAVPSRDSSSTEAEVALLMLIAGDLLRDDTEELEEFNVEC